MIAWLHRLPVNEFLAISLLVGVVASLVFHVFATLIYFAISSRGGES